MEKNLRKNKAITLVALIITIVILLILAGIAIAQINGENGILSKAKLAKEKTIKEQDNEYNILDGYQEKINDIVGSRNIKDEKSEIIQAVEFEINNVEAKSIKVHINPTSVNNEKILGYHIISQSIDNPEDVKSEMTKQVDIDIENLIPATDYKIYVAAYDYYNNVRYSEIKTYTTNMEIKVQSETSSIKISVDKPNCLKGTIKYAYKINNGEYTDFKTENEYKFENIYSDVTGVECTLSVKAQDESGREINTSIKAKTGVKNNMLVNNSSKVLATIGGRNYYKRNNIPAIAGIGIIQGYKGVFFISTDKSAVTYYTSYAYRDMESIGSINYNGIEYYYSSWGEWMPQNESITTSLVNINTVSVDNPKTLAEQLINLYYN